MIYKAPTSIKNQGALGVGGHCWSDLLTVIISCQFLITVVNGDIFVCFMRACCVIPEYCGNACED